MAKYKSNPLLDAFFKKDLKKMEELIRQGIDVNITDSDKRTVLIHAAADNVPQFVEFLLKNGADVKLKDSGDWTALHAATQSNSEEIVKMLLKKKPEVDAQDENGNTPLSNAIFYCDKKNFNIIKILLDQGAKKSLKNKSGVSPADLAKTLANENILQLLK